MNMYYNELIVAPFGLEDGVDLANIRERKKAAKMPSPILKQVEQALLGRTRGQPDRSMARNVILSRTQQSESKKERNHTQM